MSIIDHSIVPALRRDRAVPAGRTLHGVARRLKERTDAFRARFAPTYQVPRKAIRIVKDYALDCYLPMHGTSWRRRVTLTPLLLLVECVAYGVDELTERARDVDLDVVRNDDYHALHRRRATFERLLRRVRAHNAVVAQQLDLAEQYVRLENKVTSNDVTAHDDVMRLAELRPSDVRLLHGLVLGSRASTDDPLLQVLWPVEVLADIGNDLQHYYRDVVDGRFNVYAAFVRLYGDEAPERIRAELDRYERQYHDALETLDPARRETVRRLCDRLYQPRTADVPVPLAPGQRPTADQVATGSTPVVVTIGMACVVSWMVAYAAIIYRGFADDSFGMPVTALAANLAWEAIYAFVLDPLGDYLHIQTIPAFFIDLVIAWQVLRNGRSEFSSPFVVQNFGTLLTAAVASALPLMYYAFIEFEDPMGEYTGFGINLMMSLLFVAMLQRRGSSRGQSMYIALSKGLGTLFAYLATAVEATTTHSEPWPKSLRGFVRDTLTHKTYPLTPLISWMYAVTFAADVLYSVLLHRQLKADGLRPWRRL